MDKLTELSVFVQKLNHDKVIRLDRFNYSLENGVWTLNIQMEIQSTREKLAFLVTAQTSAEVAQKVLGVLQKRFDLSDKLDNT